MTRKYCEGDIGDILTKMMADEKKPHWAALLPRVQCSENSRHHSAIQQSPFEDMFAKNKF